MIQSNHTNNENKLNSLANFIIVHVCTITIKKSANIILINLRIKIKLE